MREWRGLAFLAWLTFERQLATRKTLLAIGLLTMLVLVTILWARRSPPGELPVSRGTRNQGSATASRQQGDQTPTDPKRLSERRVGRFINRVVMPFYIGFLLPILCLIHATAALGEERDDRTLVYLMMRPLSRWRIYLAKGIGVLPLILLTSMGGLAAICVAIDPDGWMAWKLTWMPLLRGTVAYTSLFLLAGALLPRPVVLAVVYAFFVETLLGNMPGTIKRIAISFHVRCLIFDQGSDFGLEIPPRLQFAPISGEAAALVLDVATVGLAVLGAFLFHRREFTEFS